MMMTELRGGWLPDDQSMLMEILEVGCRYQMRIVRVRKSLVFSITQDVFFCVQFENLPADLILSAKSVCQLFLSWHFVLYEDLKLKTDLVLRVS
ncbi:hypothetical protein OUZ56_007588 [Daphnia magna]|uniref:Uncharacterized protein n=1 Tax=Daphnia magna TaxID=35525 RepID=A0ABR0AAE1_9CRUS|nr:hypothetical protein OUZ56_007588 [Daphnia magna]